MLFVTFPWPMSVSETATYIPLARTWSLSHSLVQNKLGFISKTRKRKEGRRKGRGVGQGGRKLKAGRVGLLMNFPPNKWTFNGRVHKTPKVDGNRTERLVRMEKFRNYIGREMYNEFQIAHPPASTMIFGPFYLWASSASFSTAGLFWKASQTPHLLFCNILVCVSVR